jgi:hypothetical protein
MGSVTRSITRFFASGDPVATRLKKIFTPCLRGDGTKNIDIRIFDKHELVNDMATSNEVVSDLQNFLRDLAARTDLEPDVRAQLSPITFNVTYAKKNPDQDEIKRFGPNVFPIYLLTATGSITSTREDIVSLLVSHQIPEVTFVAIRHGQGAPLLSRVNSYQDIEDDWANKPTVLGFGFPGTYFIPRSQSVCRKLGIIKMQGGMIENLGQMGRREKLVSVLKHELGHMFGLVHEANTLMDGNYDINSKKPSYSPDQMWIVVRALQVLLQN